MALDGVFKHNQTLELVAAMADIDAFRQISAKNTPDVVQSLYRKKVPYFPEETDLLCQIAPDHSNFQAQQVESRGIFRHLIRKSSSVPMVSR